MTGSNLFAVTAVVEDRRPLVVLGGFALVFVVRVAVVESPKKSEAGDHSLCPVSRTL